MGNLEYNPRQILEYRGFKTFFSENKATVIDPDGKSFWVSCHENREELDYFIWLAVHFMPHWKLKGLTYLYYKDRRLIVEDYEVEYFREKYGWGLSPMGDKS
jgi:hypothetical protein